MLMQKHQSSFLFGGSAPYVEGVQPLIAAFRMVGTRKAKLDRLLWTLPQASVELTPTFYGLSAAEMSTRFSTADTFLFDEDATLGNRFHASQP
jgi:2-oxoglutarate dehydrogenase complex dehydrogenase (E1) component-like enzyme